MPGYVHTGCFHLLHVVRSLQKKWPGDLLVVGCGDGTEALFFQNRGATVTAIDPRVPDKIPPGVAFVRCEAESMPFLHASFDYVFAYHVFEHVHDVKAAIAECRRVLRPNGLMYVGVPNRRRLASFVGRGVPVKRILKDNWIEWVDRFWGRFQNDYGAHAGFTKSELTDLLGTSFEILWLTDDYMSFKRPRIRRLLLAMRPLFPALYLIATPRATSAGSSGDFGPAR